jgi:1,4-alpha-glucan branching enzyme
MFAPSYNAQATKRLLHKLDHLVLADQRQFLEKAIHYTGCQYDVMRRTTVFGVWAPHRQRRPLYLELFIPERKHQGHFFEYKRQLIPLIRFETSIQDIDFANDFYFVIISNLVPYQKPGKGHLYRFHDPMDGSFVPDIYSHFQPFGVDGPSAVIAQYPFFCLKRSYEKKMPVSITKLHVGTATHAGTFSGLQAELKKPSFAVCDAL